MLPFVVALFGQAQAPALPSPTPVTVPNEVRDWTGFKYLPAGARAIPSVFPAPGDWSAVRGTTLPNAAVWRTKVVLFNRVDRAHERGPDLLWPGHYGIDPPAAARIRRSLDGLHALVAHLSGGAVDIRFDVTEEPETLAISGGDLADAIRTYLLPRINGGRYDAEDNVFRGPYQSVFVFHPVGGEAKPIFEVQGTPVSLVGLPDVPSFEVEGYLAGRLALDWKGQVARRAADAGAKMGRNDAPKTEDWPAILAGANDSTEQRLQIAGRTIDAGEEMAFPFASRSAGRGVDTVVALVKDPQRGPVLSVIEAGIARTGGLALPSVDGVAVRDSQATPTFSFWAKSEAKDPIVLRFDDKVVRLGVDVPFVYDNAWHPVKIDLRPLTRVSTIVIGPDATDRTKLRYTIGPVAAFFDDFELTADAPDARPTSEAPGPMATDPEARARWAATAGPGAERRALLKDPNEAVRANTLAAALRQPDPGEEPLLIQAALYTFEPSIYTPALRALAGMKTPTAKAGLREALRIAAADRARGLAAELLAESGDPGLVGLFVGLNQARSRVARIEAVHALVRLPGSEAALMRMAYLAQDDPELKLAVTATADPNDDAQGRKLLWSAVNEPSDAVRLESLRRLSRSTVSEFQKEGLNGVRDDSVGVRVGLLEAWAKEGSADVLPAVRIALADSSPRVRAAAVSALAVAPIDPKDVPFADPDPRVQFAVLRLAKEKGLAIPSEARDRWRKSPDPQVRAAAG